ncbi:hypothetical protein, partial [Streptomyces sp. CC224B]|uniref:hypothetical protein n=1 Tax=Streptomyces sp. CC224B TaxID=3044571 RepID=UPI0024A9CF86
MPLAELGEPLGVHDELGLRERRTGDGRAGRRRGVVGVLGEVDPGVEQVQGAGVAYVADDDASAGGEEVEGFGQ